MKSNLTDDVANDAISTMLNLANKLKEQRELEHKLQLKVLDIYADILHKKILTDRTFSSYIEMREVAEESVKDELDAVNNAIISLRKKLFAMINVIGQRIVIPNSKLANIITVTTGEKWMIVEGGEIWANLSKRCNVAGIYAVSKKTNITICFTRNIKRK